MVIIRIARGGAGGVCPNAIKDNQNNDFNAFFQDIDGIAVPANPAAGHRRLFVDSADDVLKIRTAAGVTTSLEAGAGGGEINTISSSGLGTSDLSAVPSKVALDLRVKTLSVSCPITKTDACNVITLDLANLPALGTLPASPRPTCITNAEIIAAAGIPYSKLTFANNIVAGDIAACAIGSSELANCSVDIAAIQNNAVTLAKMAGGTDGNLITYDACGNPAFVATGTACQVLTSNGAGAAPTFQAGGGGGGCGYTVVAKACDQTYTTTCYVNSVGQSFAVAANSTYGFIHWFIFRGEGTCSTKTQYTVPACTESQGYDTDFDQRGAELCTWSNCSAIGNSACCGITYSFRVGSIKTGGTAGTLQVQTAKFADTTCNDTIELNRSYLAWVKLT